ncbi:hypothetical protein GCM10023191_097720 [Actinoallomurus oryzae]|uniref:DUF4282 domain-containing protein n=2 Tax=Actinoallomurus oryzae TaxID=502180 RepID=A0ABP8R7V0_9ACTN
MSNPHDDPGHRPPPPRQGEPQPSYPGGPPPPPYQTDPHAYPGPPPQPGGPWQAPPPGHGAPPPPPGYAPRGRGNKGFFGTLFDVNFDHMLTVRLARTIYTLMTVLITMFALVVLWYGLSFFTWNPTLAVMTIVAAPLIWLFDLVVIRVFMEFVINQFKITEHLKAMREREGLR